MERWVGRVALVTGASSGIGAAICRVLVKEGLKVVGCARNVERINKLSEQLSSEKAPGHLHGIRCDLTNEEEINKLFEEIKSKYAGLDLCINNAGLGLNAPILSGNTAEWRKMFDVNVMALSICSREAWKIMMENNIGDGQFIHINSSYTFGSPILESSHYYAATKSMVNSFVKCQLSEIRSLKYKTKVTQISPGLVETEFVERKLSSKDAAKEIFSSHSSLKANDIADSVLYILKCPSHVNIDQIVLNAI